MRTIRVRGSRRQADGMMEALEARKLLATFMVDLAVDENDGNTGPGDLSLREAILLANDNEEADTIQFSSAIAGETIGLTQGELLIRDDLTVRGYDENGADAAITLDGLNDTRIFRIADLNQSHNSEVVLENLRLINADSGGDDGGAIFSTENLSIRDSEILNGTARAGFGGAVYQTALTGSLEIVSSVIRGNVAERGGGVFVIATRDVRLESSEISDNSADGPGGGIRLNSLTGNAAISNSTISGNRTEGDGGGLAIASPGSTISIANSTIAGNIADSDDDSIGAGGGLLIESGQVELSSTIVADNEVGADTAGDLNLVLGALDTDNSTNNLIEAPETAIDLEDGVNGNIIGADPGLLPLSNNGGGTRTHALSLGSVAIDAGVNPIGLAFDQRGSGFQRVVNGVADIGAFEHQDTELDLNALRGSLPLAVSDANDEHWVVVRNGDGDIVVFTGQENQWQAYRLRDRIDAPAATSEPVVWTSPDDGLVHIGVPSDDGFLVYERDTLGVWSVRNLTDELNLAGASPTDRLTQFTTTDGRVSVAGYAAGGELVLLQHTGDTDAGDRVWAFKNLSDDLQAQGMSTPDFTEIVSYVTPWNQWTVAGISDVGDIIGVWIHEPSFDLWRVDNLSDLYGAPPITGQLTVTQTSWQAINLAGIDGDGHLVVTWWVPGFGGDWAVSDLTTINSGPDLINGRITGFVTPWGAMNYAGLNEQGDVIAYWWVPNAGWNVSILADADTADNPLPTGTLTDHVSEDGTMSILGTSDNDHVTRLWWAVDSNGWTLTDLTDVAEII